MHISILAERGGQLRGVYSIAVWNCEHILCMCVIQFFLQFCKFEFLCFHKIIKKGEALVNFAYDVLIFLKLISLLQNIREDDENDEKEGILETNSQTAAEAYRPPFLRPISFDEEGSSSHQQHI